jgi:hypothetical protein
VQRRVEEVVTLAYSTTRPAYITQTTSAFSATTPRSWVMSMTAMPRALEFEVRSSRIWAWIVTSSAVVGSSASRVWAGRPGPSRSSRAGACRRRTGAGRLDAALGLGDADVAHGLEGDLAGRLATETCWWSRIASMI